MRKNCEKREASAERPVLIVTSLLTPSKRRMEGKLLTQTSPKADSLQPQNKKNKLFFLDIIRLNNKRVFSQKPKVLHKPPKVPKTVTTLLTPCESVRTLAGTKKLHVAQSARQFLIPETSTKLCVATLPFAHHTLLKTHNRAKFLRELSSTHSGPAKTSCSKYPSVTTHSPDQTREITISLPLLSNQRSDATTQTVDYTKKPRRVVFSKQKPKLRIRKGLLSRALEDDEMFNLQTLELGNSNKKLDTYLEKIPVSSWFLK